jgi:hypothetical protein
MTDNYVIAVVGAIGTSNKTSLGIVQIRLEQSNSANETALKEQKGKQPLDQQSPHDSFELPDLNLPAQDNAEGSSVHC